MAGLPELSTEREDALRRQLGSTLKRIEELFNAERSTSATLQPVQDVSQRLLQRQTQQEHQEEQHLLSQQVVNELKSGSLTVNNNKYFLRSFNFGGHFFAGGVGVETDSDAAILVSENRWQNQEIDVDDANENLENIDEAVVDEEKSKVCRILPSASFLMLSRVTIKLFILAAKCRRGECDLSIVR